MKNRLLKTFTSLVLTVLMVISVMPAFAITIGAENSSVTIGFSGGTEKNMDTISFSDDTTGVSVVFKKNTHNTSPRWDSDCVRFYGTLYMTNSMTVSVPDGCTIKSITFAMNGNYTLANVTPNFGTISGTEWTADSANSAGSVVFTTTARTRFEGVTVTYTEAGSDTCEHEWSVTDSKGATCTENGYVKSTCSKCGATKTEATDAALGHNEENHDVQTPTCTSVGWDAYVTCTRCDYTTYKEIAALGHNFENGKCTICSKKAPSYTLIDLANIQSTDTIIIVATTSKGTYAMSNDKEAKEAPTAVTVKISDGIITTDATNILWNISKDGDNNLTIYVNGTTNTWLYCTNTNDGVKVGTNKDNNIFTLHSTSGYLKNTATNRFLGVYTTKPDWRCYQSTTGNIAKQTFSFYKLDENTEGGSEGSGTDTPVTPTCEHANTVEKERVNPTCTEVGHEAGTYCLDCDTYTNGGTEISAIGYHTWNGDTCTVCGDKTDSIPEVLESADDTAVVVCGTVTLINTAWNDSYGNISVTISDADGNILYLYRLATKVELGDIIRVTGNKSTYNGNAQIAANATAEIIGHKDVEVVYTEMTIPGVIAANDNTPVTVKGTVKEINTPWNDYNKNISVTIVDADGNELYMYRLATKVDLGDEITVKGLVGSYNSNKQIAAGATAEITGKATVLNSVALSLNKGVTVKVKITIPEKWLTAGAKVVFSNVVSLDAKAGENVYSVDLTPAQINDALTVKLTDAEGNTILVAEKDVSVSAYKDKAVAANASEQLIALLDAALTYSSVADRTYNGEDLKNEFDGVVNHSHDGELFTGFAGQLGTYASIYINVNTANVKEGDKLVLKIGETGIINDDIAKYITKDGQIVISGLYPANFDDTISIDTTIEGSNATFTFNSYLKAIYKDNSSTQQVKNLAVATYQYGLAAKAYLNPQ